MFATYHIPKAYCLTYRNPERRARMEHRFQATGFHAEFVESPSWDDPRIKPPDGLIEIGKAAGTWSEYPWSCIHGHFDILEKFVYEGGDTAIVVEDDVHLYRDIVQELPVVVANFHKLKLEMLLLGYLNNIPMPQVTWDFAPKGQQFTYHNAGSRPYGTQMYMIGRNYAIYILEHFGPKSGWPLRSLANPHNEHCVADWIITKMSWHRALIYPQLAIEEGAATNTYNWYHQQCFDANYNPIQYI